MPVEKWNSLKFENRGKVVATLPYVSLLYKWIELSCGYHTFSILALFASTLLLLEQEFRISEMAEETVAAAAPAKTVKANPMGVLTGVSLLVRKVWSPPPSNVGDNLLKTINFLGKNVVKIQNFYQKVGKNTKFKTKLTLFWYKIMLKLTKITKNL